MKLLLLFTVLLSLRGESSFYEIQFENLNGQTLHTERYKGKKVIISIQDAEKPDLKQLRYFDSLQKSSSNLEIICVLTEDFGKKAKLKDAKDSTMKFQLLVTKPLKVKKEEGVQHPLLTWLTNQKENMHFDVDVKSAGQLFFISGKGTLYAVLIKETPMEVIAKVINQPFAE
jgi:glutathione peroxidase-family protein